MSIVYWKENRDRLIQGMKDAGINQEKKSFIFLRGSYAFPEYDADTNYSAKYEESFQYLFGVMQFDIDGCIEYPSGKTILIQPDLVEGDYYNKYMRQEEAIKNYGVDQVLFYSDFVKFIKLQEIEKIFRFKGYDPFSKKWSNYYDQPIVQELKDKLEDDLLFPMINNFRCLKKEKEIQMMKEAVQISCRAHEECMRNCRPGMWEYEIQGIFTQSFTEAGAEDHAYNPICGANRNGAYLHYMVNDQKLKDNQLILCDMGCKLNGVCSDITCTYPINGKFSKKQKEIYDIVLHAQRNAIEQLKPGVPYVDLQTQGYKIILQGLKDLKILKGDIEQMYNQELHRVFMPHRLGHFIGYKTHDVGPQVKKTGDKEKDKQYKTVDQCELEEGMTLTVEPGIYFIDFKIEETKQQPIKVFIDYEQLRLYRNEVGGVRIEDVLAVTKDGYLNLTDAPRTTEEIEKIMNHQ